MPWSERTKMDQRMGFVTAWSSGLFSMTELCKEYGVSRPTGYKWANRYRREGVDGLKDRSKAPRSCAHGTDERCEQALVEERRKHPDWGGRKLLRILSKRHPDWPWPAESTAGEIFKRHGLVKPGRRARRVSPPGKPIVDACEPNDLWTADFKGQFRMGNAKLCYPLTAADQASRYLLACEGKDSVVTEGVKPVFEDLFKENGLPLRILTDGGPPFANARTPQRLSRLSVWWLRLGVEPVLIEPGQPWQNGCHERMHRTLKQATARPPASSMKTQQQAFNHFRKEYNEIRPHESLEMQCPADLYRPSGRDYPSKLEEFTYPGHYEVRRVSAEGSIKWCGEPVYVSEAFRRERVGLAETDDGVWSMYLGPLLLGRYDHRAAKLYLL